MPGALALLAVALVFAPPARAGADGADSCGPEIACRATPFTRAEQARHEKLLAEVVALARNGHELADGYAFELPADGPRLARVVEWVGLERRCCPFLLFHLEWPGDGGKPTLSVRGPGQSKELVLSTLRP